MENNTQTLSQTAYKYALLLPKAWHLLNLDGHLHRIRKLSNERKYSDICWVNNKREIENEKCNWLWINKESKKRRRGGDGVGEAVSVTKSIWICTELTHLFFWAFSVYTHRSTPSPLKHPYLPVGRWGHNSHSTPTSPQQYTTYSTTTTTTTLRCSEAYWYA